MSNEIADKEKKVTLEKIYKPLAQAPYEEPKLSFHNPAFYPEELSKDLFSLLRTPLPNGTTVPLVKLSVKQEQSKYWFDKINMVGAIIGASTLTLLVILLQETDVLNVIWQGLLAVL